MEELTARQQEILDYIKKEVQKKGYPPSVREIGEAVGLSSSSSVHAHLEKLEEMGYLRRDPTKPRAIEVLTDDTPLSSFDGPKNLQYVPIVGAVTAGAPILAEQNIQDYFPLPKDFSRSEETFMLKVRGDSMTGAGIFDGDMVIVNKESVAKNGDIVVALLGDEATVKRFYKETTHVRLQPENDQYEPILSPNVQVLGKVVGLIRRIN
ncbi:MAG: transcriptional repressor LexA [Bacteroidota bacterium]